MQVWRQGYGDSVNFVCVCVDEYARDTALEFQEYYFQGGGVINSFIEPSAPQDFPSFPAQLGCQGFVILDAAGRFVTIRSAPKFTEARGKAFTVVERLLAPLLAAKQGREVVLSGLSAADVNGRRGVELPDYPASAGRIAVKLEGDGRIVSVRHVNVTPAAGAPDASAGARLPASESTEPRATFAKNACRDAPAEIGGDVPDLPPVGHAEMDAEHASLVTLCRAASASLARADVDALRREFAEHSAHEEDLLARCGFGGSAIGASGGPGAFSALASHAADHRRIVELAESAVGQADAATGLVPRAVVAEVCLAIVEHARNYDSLYAEAVAAH